MNWAAQCIAVIPCHNESASIGRLVLQIRRYLPNVVVVDDGSTDITRDLARGAGAKVVHHDTALGKGAALNTGWRYALDHGFSWALCMDGDGQHAPADIPKFLRAGESAHLVVGDRMSNPGKMPWLRRQV